jgi:hypothetical protein
MDSALKVAIDLLHSPSQVRRIRSIPLPDDTLVLLRIASGDEEARRSAALRLGRSRETVSEAAEFFIVQILLFPGADSYRVLGASPQATPGELRRNMALLFRWLHPDVDPNGERSVFATRVTRAWNDLKTGERRAAYDQSKSASRENKLRRTRRPSSAQSSQQGFVPRPFGKMRYAGHVVRRSNPYQRTGLLRRMLLFFFGRAAL